MLGQVIPIHFTPSFFFKLYFNVIIQPKLLSREWSHPFRFPNLNFVCIYRLSHNLNQRDLMASLRVFLKVRQSMLFYITAIFLLLTRIRFYRLYISDVIPIPERHR